MSSSMTIFHTQAFELGARGKTMERFGSYILERSGIHGGSQL